MINSINTNTGAMTALQALNASASNIQKTENEVSTGLTVSSPADDGATWAAAQNMRRQVSGWQTVSDSLNRGQSIVDVATGAAQSISDLLSQIRAAALSYSDPSNDATSLATYKDNIQSLIGQLNSIATTSNFNGINLLDATSSSGDYQVTSNDQPGQQTLTITTSTNATAIAGWCPLTSNITAVTYTSAADGTTTNLTPPVFAPDPNGDQNGTATLASPLGPGTFNFTFSTPPGEYFGGDVLGEPSSAANVLANPDGETLPLDQFNLTASGLSLDNMDWSDPSGVISTIDAAASTVNSATAQLGNQSNILTNYLSSASQTQNALTAGIGNLVDADVAADSAQLTAEQTKQQLAAQSLSIANQFPASLLSLFRN